jgi:CHAT domain-containing protein
MVLGPVAAKLSTTRLLVVADGVLQYIPFGALPVSGQDGITKQSTPLVVQHEIVNLPSASVLVALRQRKKLQERSRVAVAILADPVFDTRDSRLRATAAGRARPLLPRQQEVVVDSYASGATTLARMLTRSALDLGLRTSGTLALPRLLYSRLEAEAILAALPPGSGMTALDFDASRATVNGLRLADYGIVHFATHALVNDKHPQLSGLVLSMVTKDGNPQNGFLDLQDIYDLDLPVDLVVLSACETGLGKDYGGEGLIGLTRGFMYAGAKRVVSSLWSVSDIATAELMRRLYRGMAKDGLRPSEALRQAQIQMWKQKRWTSPYYWAAFQIQGEWK